MHIQKVQQVVLRERVVMVLVVFLIAQVHQPPLLYMLPIDVSSKMRILVTLTSSSNLLSGLKAYLTQSISSYRLCLKRGIKFPSVHRKEVRLHQETQIEPCLIDCCYNNCIAFTGPYSECNTCPYCKEPRCHST